MGTLQLAVAILGVVLLNAARWAAAGVVGQIRDQLSRRIRREIIGKGLAQVA
ncbi:hypothetical protein [Streptomyces sp. XD-27]|uniref:hypothetical protein n=1 Tax=Streptomyces sp. XD-27 TaxID=3062779 RepID=UPI0026F47BC3|nr:hypothetical protein [Streptomyces sp. XD-27]WKX69004.1 hypothetical protein Q3Y56_02920 [Streptomyces sp. XD-27]